MDDVEKQVKELVSKAAGAALPDDAMKYAQAALNAANAARVIIDMKRALLTPSPRTS
jgi:hypothetical protein